MTLVERESSSILVVDDDRATRLLMRHKLERDGYVVEEAADGGGRDRRVPTDQPGPRTDGREHAWNGRLCRLRGDPETPGRSDDPGPDRDESR